MLINPLSSTVQSPVNYRYTENTTGQKNASSSRVDISINQRQTQASSIDELNSTLVQQRELQKLKNIDREVRAHERAHLSVAGRYATSGATYSFQKGPDGRLYAVSGEVGIDTSGVAGDPRATLLKAQTIVRAALAPTNPSAQDRRVAAEGTALAQQARIDMARQAKTGGSREPGGILDAFA